MKKILFLILISVNCLAQTKLDSLVFEKINEYRISKGLNALAFDVSIWKAANLHSNYLSNINKDIYKTIIGHHEDTLKTADTRLAKYSKIRCHASECVVGVNLIKIYSQAKNNNDFNDKAATLILNAWIASKPHNAILLDPIAKFGGISSVKDTRYNGSFSTFVCTYK